MSWLDELKVGDKVLINHDITSTVTGETKTQWLVKWHDIECRFMKNNGRKFGDKDQWRPTYIHQWTQEAEDRIKAEHERKNVLYRISCVNWKNIPTETINKIIALLQEKQVEARNA